MEFSRQDYCSGLPGIFLTLEPGSIEPGPPTLQEDSLLSEPPGKPQIQVEPYGITDIWPFFTYTVEKAVATHSSTLAWKIPWTEEPGRLQSMGLLRVGQD